MPHELGDSFQTRHTEPQRVVDLTQRRLQRLERTIAEARMRLEKSELVHFRAEIEMGRLRREFAHRKHELKMLKARLGRLAPADECTQGADQPAPSDVSEQSSP